MICHPENRLAENIEYVDIRAKYKKAANLDVKVVSTVLFELENQCLEQLCCFLHQKGILPHGEGVLCFDGVMVPDSEENQKLITASFLDEAAQYIAKHVSPPRTTTLRIKNKPLVDGYPLPDGYELAESYVCIENGDDQSAADFIVRLLSGRIVRSNNRYFVRQKDSVIYQEGHEEARTAIINMSKSEALIVAKTPDGQILPYSRNTTRRVVVSRKKASAPQRGSFQRNFLRQRYRSPVPFTAL
jgi:hypothetical protein